MTCSGRRASTLSFAVWNMAKFQIAAEVPIFRGSGDGRDK
jgi:hypothetical protein